ncbi:MULTISPECIES: FecCD family ABC transporter permease [Fusobacterium]|jgi:iron complex transport system permease protein|uniref:Iron ABC transporter permease n=2 Tax=Fusobacterium TaxID=848 RepID=A0ABN5JI86_FUSVA|nr:MULTISPECIES: iron ABC transporter permease [Fusobacterium]AVQ31838.1 iron ABC transporter permease [Fusobacterium varium ATCC 27725]EES63193.1 putative corrinoid ABC transporter permease [Fusobacterium varium ATCC 27725]MCD7980148.1 iron ABC transporter permease [Fusobacterium sp.]MCF0171506.1 iron ABC transporter permease [Fusobacterium varium]MCF2672332.1 iron ABC transporter permease [Fusobacterium varium]
MEKVLPLLLIIGTLAAGILSIPLGSVPIPLEYIFNPEKAPEYIKIIIFNLRLPRIVMSILVGMMLSSSGVVVQTVFQNPLADPYIIGIAASATFGAVIAFVFNMPDYMYGVIAFFTCLSSTLLIFKMAKKGNKVNVATLLIVGIAVSSFLGAFTSFAMYLIGEDSFKITMWMMGYLGNATWNRVIFLAIPLVFSVSYFYLKRNQLDALLSGDEEAHSLGIDVNKLKVRTLTVAALVVAFSVAFSGMIGFVGLIVPHTMRMLLGPSNSKLLPSTILAGGFFLLICDTFGRLVLAPTEVPIGVITAFFGAPFFLYLALRNKRRDF